MIRITRPESYVLKKGVVYGVGDEVALSAENEEHLVKTGQAVFVERDQAPEPDPEPAATPEAPPTAPPAAKKTAPKKSAGAKKKTGGGRKKTAS